MKLNKDRLYLIAVNKDRFTVEFECFVYHVKALVCYMISTLKKKKKFWNFLLLSKDSL